MPAALQDDRTITMSSTQMGLPWHVGRSVLMDLESYPFTMDYDLLKGMHDFRKDRSISLISSSKSYSPDHAKRLEFARTAYEHFGSRLDFFAGGIRYVEDKWGALATYKYHIVIEDYLHSDCWMEKLADTFLAGSYPLYYECPNLADYFPRDSYTTIDINDVEKSVALIEKVINDNTYERSKIAIMQARELVLDKYNVFVVIEDLCTANNVDPISESEMTLLPEHTYSIKRKIRLKLRPRSRCRALRTRLRA